MIDPETTERLVGYLDGELTAAETADVEQLLEADEQARQFLAEMKRNDEMIALANTIDVPDGYWNSFDERLTGRILRREARRRADRHHRRHAAPSRRRSAWSGVLQMAAAIVLAGTVALQIGIHIGGRGPTTPGEDVVTPVADPSPPQRPGPAEQQFPGRLVLFKGGNRLEPIRPLSTEQLNGILMAAESQLTTLANGRVAQPEELKAYQVILVNTNLLRQLDAARNTTGSEPRVLYVLNNTYDVLNRAANAKPDQAKVVAASLQKDVNDLGLIDFTQELLRDNQEIARSRATRMKAGAAQ